MKAGALSPTFESGGAILPATGGLGLSHLNSPFSFRGGRDSIDFVQTNRRLIPHSEAVAVLRRAGYPSDLIEKLKRELPDPIDTERDAETLRKYGVSFQDILDRMRGSG